MAFQNFVEEIQVLGRDLVDKVKSLIHEGNVQRIIVKDEHGNTFVEIPVTIAAIGAIIAPLLAGRRSHLRAGRKVYYRGRAEQPPAPTATAPEAK